ncbi:hypothetical protein Tco_0647223, partial [Tanacetum coccineum]
VLTESTPSLGEDCWNLLKTTADSIKSFLLIMFLLVMFSFLLTEIESADFVSAGHVLVPADRDRIC